MKKLKVLNPMAFIYLFFAVFVCIFTAVEKNPEEEQTILFSLSVISVVGAIVLFILEGYYYPKMTKRVDLNTGKPIDIDTNLSPYLNLVLSLSFLCVLLWFGLEGSGLWFVASMTWLVITLCSHGIVRRNLEKWYQNERLKDEAKYPYACGLDFQDVEDRIEFISKKEQGAILRKWYVGALFFPVSIVFLILLYFKIKEGAAEWVVIQYCVYAFLIIAGYIWHLSIEKKLSDLWETKKSFIDFLSVARK